MYNYQNLNNLDSNKSTDTLVLSTAIYQGILALIAFGTSFYLMIDENFIGGIFADIFILLICLFAGFSFFKKYTKLMLISTFVQSIGVGSFILFYSIFIGKIWRSSSQAMFSIGFVLYLGGYALQLFTVYRLYQDNRFSADNFNIQTPQHQQNLLSDSEIRKAQYSQQVQQSQPVQGILVQTDSQLAQSQQVPQLQQAKYQPPQQQQGSQQQVLYVQNNTIPQQGQQQIICQIPIDLNQIQQQIQAQQINQNQQQQQQHQLQQNQQQQQAQVQKAQIPNQNQQQQNNPQTQAPNNQILEIQKDKENTQNPK